MKAKQCRATQPKWVEAAKKFEGRERCPIEAHPAQWSYRDQFCAGHQFNRYGSIAKKKD